MIQQKEQKHQVTLLFTILVAFLLLNTFYSAEVKGESSKKVESKDLIRPRLEEAEKLNQQVSELYQQGKYQEAIPIAKKVLSIRKEELGSSHLLVAASLITWQNYTNHKGNMKRQNCFFYKLWI